MTIQGLRKQHWPGHGRDTVTLPPTRVWWPAEISGGGQEPVWAAEEALPSAEVSLGGQLPLQGQGGAGRGLFPSAAGAGTAEAQGELAGLCQRQCRRQGALGRAAWRLLTNEWALHRQKPLGNLIHS